MSETTHPVDLIGLPWDGSSSFLRGPALAPDHIRRALASESSNRFSESGTEISAASGVHDAGDVTLDPSSHRRDIEQAVGGVMDRGSRVLALGGDHSVTYPILRAFGRRHPGSTLVHFDAHSDLYDSFEGDRYSHACPFARIMEEGLVGRLVQVGVRTLNPHQRQQAERFGVEIVEMAHLDATTLTDVSGSTYVSFDLDVLDPAYAPGVSHHEPGGMSTRQAIDLLRRVPGPILGADIVELNPRRDPQGITAMVAAKLVKEIAAKMLEESS